LDSDEHIQSHVLSVWREGKGFFSVHGAEGMLFLTDKHLMFITKTDAKMKWWQAVAQRQTLSFLKSKNTMIHHDGYKENDLKIDLENKKNFEITFDNILNVNYEEKNWGDVLNLEYNKDEKRKKFKFSIVQDWVRYPIKSPTKFLKVDWSPFVQFIKDRQKITK